MLIVNNNNLVVLKLYNLFLSNNSPAFMEEII